MTTIGKNTGLLSYDANNGKLSKEYRITAKYGNYQASTEFIVPICNEV